jgi:heme O synthase-like polyprenyltransferase
MSIVFSLLLKADSLPHTGAGGLTNILNIILSVMGALAFLMVVIGGFRYTIAGGNADSVAGARRMIIYSVIGLVVIALAASIVNFVLDKV